VTELLKRVLNWASEQEMVSGLPKIRWKSLKLKEDGPRERVLSDAELDSLRAHMTGDGYCAAFEFALMTGLRLENFSELRWDQIGFDETSIPIRQKGDKPHKVELTPSVRALLESQKGNHPEFVFAYIVNRTAKNPKNPGVLYEKGARMPVTYWGFRSRFQRVTKAAGIKNVRVHDLRKRREATCLMCLEI
jgi:integrase